MHTMFSFYEFAFQQIILLRRASPGSRDRTKQRISADQCESFFRPDSMSPGTVKARGSWASKTEFILSCMGYAIGIGNVWRFPYLCYRNGGGAFLVPYLLMLVLCGIPLFFLEVSLGQFAGTGCITVFKIAPLLKGAGMAIVVINFICTSYYNVIISYPILFLWKSLQAQLPWENCQNPWNTPRCVELGGSDQLHMMMNNSLLSVSERLRTPADEFFQ